MSSISPTSSTWTPVEDWAPRPEGWELRDEPGVAIDASDQVWSISRDETPVMLRAADGTVLDRWGAGVFARPHSIRVDPFGFVWCVDDGDHTVRKFSADGTLQLELGTAGHGSDTGVETVDGDYSKFDYRLVQFGGAPFNGPTDVCVLHDGTTFVTDGYGNARVHRFSAEGALERSWGEPGTEPGQFHIPHGIVASPDEDRLFVSDRENNRVQVFDLDGALLAVWSDFSRPDGIAISPDGLLCVPELGELAGRWPHMAPVTADSQYGHIAIVDLDGTVVERFGTADPGRAGSFYAPHGVAFDSRGDLYVTEVAYSGGARLGDLPGGWHTMQKLARS
jgi:DNA-binding beta-propeller fold protein YncE